MKTPVNRQARHFYLRHYRAACCQELRSDTESHKIKAEQLLEAKAGPLTSVCGVHGDHESSSDELWADGETETPEPRAGMQSRPITYHW